MIAPLCAQETTSDVVRGSLLAKLFPDLAARITIQDADLAVTNERRFEARLST